MARNPMTDIDLLTILHLRDHEGMLASVTGERFGRSKGAIVGALWRIDKETDASDPDGNQNGTMPPKWWAR